MLLKNHRWSQLSLRWITFSFFGIIGCNLVPLNIPKEDRTQEGSEDLVQKDTTLEDSRKVEKLNLPGDQSKSKQANIHKVPSNDADNKLSKTTDRSKESNKSENETDEKDELYLSAQALEKGDRAGAILYLRKYVSSHPDQFLYQAYLAELLYKQEQYSEARSTFESFLKNVPEKHPLAQKHQIHCYTRLMEIAMKENDDYQEHLNRGIGFYLLARELGKIKKENVNHDNWQYEQQTILCKAIKELKLAESINPHQIRSLWYLSRVWHELNQEEASEIALKQMRDSSNENQVNHLTDLYPGEKAAYLIEMIAERQ